MSRVGPLLRLFYQTMPRHFTSLVLRAAALGIALVFSGVVTPAQAYVLEGKSWPAGSTVLMQLNLGSAGRTLQDGNTSWDDAVLPVAGMWNQTIERVQVTTTVNPLVPTTSGDRINSAFFSNSIFGQSFGSGTLAVTYYTSSGGSM